MTWLVFVLLALAAYRIYKLVSSDDILDRPRRWALRLPRGWEEPDQLPAEYRVSWAEFITCPWCAGFWISGLLLAVYSAVIDWPGFFWFAVIWLALSAVVGLVAHNLDSE